MGFGDFARQNPHLVYGGGGALIGGAIGAGGTHLLRDRDMDNPNFSEKSRKAMKQQHRIKMIGNTIGGGIAGGMVGLDIASLKTNRKAHAQRAQEREQRQNYERQRRSEERARQQAKWDADEADFKERTNKWKEDFNKKYGDDFNKKWGFKEDPFGPKPGGGQSSYRESPPKDRSHERQERPGYDAKEEYERRQREKASRGFGGSMFSNEPGPKNLPSWAKGAKSQQGVRDAFKKAVMAHHPDRGGNPAIFNKIVKEHDAVKAHDDWANFPKVGHLLPSMMDELYKISSANL